MSDGRPTSASRRAFLKSSVSAGVAGTVTARVAFPHVSSAGENETLKIGLIGCGGRGTGAAVQALQADANVQLTAMGDLFPDQLERSLGLLRKQLPDRIKVTPDRCFLGFQAYREVLASGVDVVLLTTPPGFRPLHLRAAVDAGKHAFVEITAAIDAPGVRSVLESAAIAKRKGLAIVSGFCWRYNERHRAVFEQIRNGVLGEIRAVYATYYRGSLSHKYHGERTAGMTELEWQIRDWYDYLWLSGDVTILLSGGHSVDKTSWWLGDEMPIRAVATGSRISATDGNTFDNGFVAYEYANGIRTFLGCRSIAGCYNENADYIIGTKGVCTIGRGKVPVIEGQTNWRYDGVGNNMYQTEHDEFLASIRSGNPINDGVRMAHTTLMAIMGRMAAYTGREINWEQAMNSQEKLVADEMDWDTRIEATPMARPGMTRFT